MGADMNDPDGWEAVIDRERCAGYETCVDLAPDLFALDSELRAVLRAPPRSAAQRAALIEAAEACPTMAIAVSRVGGGRIAPRPSVAERRGGDDRKGDGV